MQCEAARKQLYLLRKSDSQGSVFLVQTEIAQAEAHVACCAACQEFFAAEERLKTFLKARAPRDKASAAFREQLLNLVAEQHRRPNRLSGLFSKIRHRSLALLIASILIVVAVVGGFWLNKPSATTVPQHLITLLVDDHAHNLTEDSQIASTDHNKVQSWFQGKVDFTFHLPPSQDQSLMGGRLCILQDRRAALIHYKHQQSRVSLFILDGSDVELPKENLVTLDERRCLVNARKGYNVVLWKDRGLLYGMVSDINSADLLQLAAQF